MKFPALLQQAGMENTPIDELIPEEEKQGKFLYILGTIVGVLIILGVAILAGLYFF